MMIDVGGEDANIFLKWIQSKMRSRFDIEELLNEYKIDNIKTHIWKIGGKRIQIKGEDDYLYESNDSCNLLTSSSDEENNQN